MDNTGKSILLQVSYKGVIELVKTGQINYPKGNQNNEFMEDIWQHYLMLTELIERAIDDTVSNDHIMLLERLIDSSTLDSDQRVQATSTLTPTPSYDKFVQIRDRLLQNQQDQINDIGAGNQTDIKKKLKKEVK